MLLLDIVVPSREALREGLCTRELVNLGLHHCKRVAHLGLRLLWLLLFLLPEREGSAVRGRCLDRWLLGYKVAWLDFGLG